MHVKCTLLLWNLVTAQQPKPPNGRTCYGCLGWCTYGDLCQPPSNIIWHDAPGDLDIHGQGWPTSEMEKPFDRLPHKAKVIVDAPVWQKAQESSGLKLRFATKAVDLWVHWTLEPGENVYSDWLWPLTAHAGVDIYIEDDGLPGVRYRWATSSGNNPMMNSQMRKNISAGFYTGLFAIPPRSDGAPRNFTIYMPLRAAPSKVRIGALSAHGGINIPIMQLPSPERRVLFYGTSIMNGAAANRPGMAWPQQAERMLHAEGLNLGFGGSGQMQPFYSESGLLAEIDYDIIIVDCEWNMHGYEYHVTYNRTLHFVKSLLDKRPNSPVLLLEGHEAGNAWIDDKVRLEANATRSAFRNAFNDLLALNPALNLYYGYGQHKFGGRDITTDFQAQVSTVNGVHPSPLALTDIASYVSSMVDSILNGSSHPGVVSTSATSIEYRRASQRMYNARKKHYTTMPKTTRWVDAKYLAVEGKGFPAEDADTSFWQRFPQRASSRVPKNIFRLSTMPSGMLVRFRTNATQLSVRVHRLDYVPNTDDIFATNGKYGIDVYVQDPSTRNFGSWRWAATEASSSSSQNGSFVFNLAGMTEENPPDNMHNVTVYLPTYAAVASLLIGVSPSRSELQPLWLYNESTQTSPIVVWGSSIAQGGVVSNAGMTWPSNLQRILNVPLLNFGFSGSCGMQLAVAEMLTEVRPAPRAFLMDCLPNMQQDNPIEVENATVTILHYLRAKLGPKIPIIVLEGHRYTNDWIKPRQFRTEIGLASAQRAGFDKVNASGTPNIYYVSGGRKLGDDDSIVQESTGGIGVHPSSIAHLHIAQFIAEQLSSILN